MTELRRWLKWSSLAISCGLWAPSEWKILHTHSAHDYNLISFALILYLQVASFAIATIDKSRSLQWYFALNGANVLAMFVLICLFR